MPFVSLRNYVAVAPQGLLRENCEESRQEGVEATGEKGYDWPETAEDVDLVWTRVLDALQAAQGRYHISPQRVFIAGCDRGGTMALRIALEWPGYFAGAASVCGAFPQGFAPLSRLRQARHLSLLLTVAQFSQTYGPQQAARDLRLLHAAGFNLLLRQYSCPHQLHEVMLADLNRWIMSEITGTDHFSSGSRRVAWG